MRDAVAGVQVRLLLAVSVVAMMILGLIWLAPPAQADPPGNNGTVKIDGLAFDDHPNNEPHVGCVFEVDFYGFDEGDLFADVLFTVHPPTGKPVALLDDVVFIGEDSNAGGGSEAGLDASVEYDLGAALAGYAPHPQQGWHVRLTVNAEGSIGADVKHKVFWVEGCDPPTTTTTAPTTTTSTTPPTTTSTSTTSTTHQSSTTTTTRPTTTSTSRPTTTTTVGT
jgi:cell division septation protein DedD